MGYDCGAIDGIIGKQTRQAIAAYQKDHGHNVTGQLDKQAARSIFSAYCEQGCRFSIAVDKPLLPLSQKFKPLTKRDNAYPDMPVNPTDTVFAVEKVECSNFSGDYIIFYQGVVTEKTDAHVFVRLDKRYCYYYRPDKQGIDTNDWWCIPVRRHCYSPVKFNAWKGRFRPQQVVSFPLAQVFNAEIQIINGLAAFLMQTCERRF
jgi:hypothetical protein